AEVSERPVRKWPQLNSLGENVTFSVTADRYLVSGADLSFHLHRMSDQSEIAVVKTGRNSVLARPVLIPGGRFMFVWSGPAQIELWDLERGELPALWPLDVRGVSHRFDGRQVAAVRSTGELCVYDLPALTEVSRWKLGSEFPERFGYHRMELSHDGRYLALMR